MRTSSRWLGVFFFPTGAWLAVFSTPLHPNKTLARPCEGSGQLTPAVLTLPRPIGAAHVNIPRSRVRRRWPALCFPMRALPAHAIATSVLRRPEVQIQRGVATPRMGIDVELALGIIGPGLVGKALIRQIQKQSGELERFGTLLKLVGVSNSRNMLIADTPQPLDLSQWQSELSKGEATDLTKLQERLAGDQHPVIIDCTASDAVPSLYASWLKEGRRHVVTPNKRLGAGPLANYNSVLAACQEANSRFFYEATVGAGLPIVSTLQGLLRTGDELRRIEGVFSGTLSYIFNSFGPERSFSSVVADAKAAGYTEPDPRDDLSGTDVARKVVILARECGWQVELDDVEVQSLVPEPLRAAASADEFLSRLHEFDDDMAEEAQKAASDGQKLCYVGLIDVPQRKCSVRLQPYPKDHAFAALSGSDNIVSFTSERYDSQPLTVRGPGAGAEVTAAGVFSDLILLARSLGARC